MNGLKFDLPVNPQENTPDLHSRAARVTWARKKAGLSQRQLAKQIGVSARTVQLMELKASDGGSRRSKYLYAVARITEVSVDWLMENIGPPFLDQDLASVYWLPVHTSHSTDPLTTLPMHRWLLGESGKNTFLYLVDDASMTPRYPEQSLLAVDPDASPCAGGDVVVRIETDRGSPRILRTWRDRDDEVELYASNGEFCSYRRKKSEVEVLGVVEGIWIGQGNIDAPPKSVR